MCSCSRICTGRTMRCSTSSTSSSSAPEAFPCSCWAPRAQSSWNAGPDGEAASRTPSTISLSPLSDRGNRSTPWVLLEEIELNTPCKKSSRAGRRQPALRRAVRPKPVERGALLGAAGDGAGNHRPSSTPSRGRRSGRCRTLRGRQGFRLGAVEADDGGAAGRPRSCCPLARKEFVQRVPHLVGRDRERVRFRHALIRDVAYGQIPRAARSQKHSERRRGSSRWDAPRNRPKCSPTTTCRRSIGGGRRVDAAELNKPARHALRDAGDRAAALYAADAAERFYDAALRLWPEQDKEGHSSSSAVLCSGQRAEAEIETAGGGQGCPARRRRQGKAAEAEMYLDQPSGCRAGASAAEHAERAGLDSPDARPSRRLYGSC